MDDINSIAFALDPNNVPVFLLDWEITRLCNLDCSYCNHGHDNSTKHPPLDQCLQTLDFMYEYVNMYMSHKKPTQRKVILNVYGGESLVHPDIVSILQACRQRYQKYSEFWELTVTCTTNAIVGNRVWRKVIPLIDEFTVSYHAETLEKQRSQFKANLLTLKQQAKKFKCIVMMHNDPDLWKSSEGIIEFCKIHDIRYTPKPVDKDTPDWAYTAEQFGKFKVFWMSQTSKKEQQVLEQVSHESGGNTLSEGRSCCGGRPMAINGDLKSRVNFVPKQGFQGWSCSVNWFFLFVRQLTGEVFTNKDCQTSTTGRVEPLGNLSNYSQILHTLKTQFETKTMPVIKCVKPVCRCGFCAPKARDGERFHELIKRHVVTDVFSDRSSV